MEPVFVILIVALFVGLLILGWYQRNQRRKELSAWASSRGLSFCQENIDSFENQFAGFSCLEQGRNRYAYNVSQGNWSGREVICFDYHYETQSTDSKGHTTTTNYYFSGVIVCSVFPLEYLFIRPEGFFDKIKSFFGAEDINFESAEFSRKFFVKANDRKWAYDVIHPRAMEFLMDRPQHTIEFNGRHVLVTRDSKTFSLQEFEAAIEMGKGLLDMLPEYVTQQQTERYGLKTAG